MREIRESNPYTMSWSNVSDYFHPKTFFAIAKKCSAPSNTIHYLYSMYWEKSCFGTSIYDTLPTDRKYIVERSNNCINATYKKYGLNEYLALPTFTDAINSGSFVLHFEQYENWCKKFFACGSFKNPSQWRCERYFFDPIKLI